ncbi:MAG: hypothetical protein WCL49_08620, partial [bacterium]
QGSGGSNPSLSAILRSAPVGLSYGLPCVALAKQGWSPTKNLRRRAKDGTLRSTSEAQCAVGRC